MSFVKSGDSPTIEEVVLAAFELDVALSRYAVGQGTRVGARVPAATTAWIPALVGVRRRRSHTTWLFDRERTFDVDIRLVAEMVDPFEPWVRILSFDVDRAK